MTRAVRALACAAIAASLLPGCRGDLESPDPVSRARAVRSLSGRDAAAALLVASRDRSALVRTAAAETFARRADAGAADALGKLLVDPSPAVATAAAAGLGAMANEGRARQHLVAAYVDATPAGRAAIADALDRLGVSLREAVEAEARTRWERNVAALERGKGAPRAGAAEELGASGRNDAVQKLVPLVDPNRTPDRLLCAAAARGLGESADWAARPFLEALLADDDPLLAESAAQALGRLGDPVAADALAAAASGDPGRVATAAGEALAALPEAPEVGVALCEVAVRAPDPALAALAARDARRRDAQCPVRPILGKLGRPGAVSALAALAELSLAAADAAEAVARIAPLLDPARGGDVEVRAAAACTLAALGGPAAAAAVTKRAQALAARVTERRARWIAGPPPPTAPPEWIDAVGPDDARELGAALAAAGRLRADGAEALLLPAARDPLPAVRAGAVEGLGRLGSAPAQDAVAVAIGDPDPAVRAAAADGLARMGARGAGLLARVVDAGPGSAEWRVRLARDLGETGAPEAIPALEKLLDGPAARDAAAALARIGAPAGAAPLVAHLARAGAAGRADAVEALAQLVARDAAPAIAALLVDDSPDVRATAARALGRLRHEAAAPRLEALRSDYHGRVRRAAVEALSKFPAGAPRSRR